MIRTTLGDGAIFKSRTLRLFVNRASACGAISSTDWQTTKPSALQQEVNLFWQATKPHIETNKSVSFGTSE